MFWAYRSLQSQMSGGLRKFHQPTIWAARGRRGGGKILPKLERGQLFCQLEGRIGLRRAIVARLWGCHVIALARPPIPRIILLGLRRWGPHQKNTSKLEFRSLFTPNGPAKGAWGITPLPPKLGHRTASRKGGGRGGEGRNRPKLEFWRLFAIGHLFKSSRIQDGNAPRKYFRPAASRSHIATIILHHTACKSTVATG